ncbi:hypothetical protein K461DRAFT_298272 [Myriangium duriaei CBS 260.36]|uniref:Xylanolytic transcriptional activator regulatory domain-containing protein n=1 Tax=Myriangium duriaei CBS 260.36 TaxID=1168546 RepID=A0A9P4MBJ8_9PEZI|nr:hypothetical protein K461DRAFT_298272 [Myriangium duriaei CBS 260.36]
MTGGDSIKTHWPTPKRRKESRQNSAPVNIECSAPRVEAALDDATPLEMVTSQPGITDVADDIAARIVTTSQDRPDRLARTCLSRFFQEGIQFADWHVFENNDSFRLVYVGSAVSNLAELVRLRLTHRTFATNGNVGQDLDVQAALHYPYPQIRLPGAWRPASHEAYDALPPAEDTAEDLHHFPVQEVRQALLDAYFEHIHPTFPVVAKSQFLDNDPVFKPPPPLLYQAVLLAGAHVCSHPLVERDRWLVKAILFRRASMLYHLRRETDRLYLTQAALLFTWHVNDGDTVAGGPWYWSGIAVRLGYGQGTHRHNPSLPVLERVLHKRTWWCTVVCEIFSALESGRPCSIQWDSIDQTFPTEEDMHWGELALDLEQQSHDSDPFSLSRYHVGMIELARIGLKIIEMNFPGKSNASTITEIDSHLASWSIQMGLASDFHHDDFFTRQLGLHYNLLVLYLHRSHSRISQASQKACSVASESINNILGQLSAHQELGRCHFTMVSAATAVSINLIYDIRSAIATDASLATVGFLDRLHSVLKITKQMLPLWPNAEAVYNVFEGLKREYGQAISHRVCERVSPSIPETIPEWSELFTSNFTNQSDMYSLQQPWLDLVNWTESLQYV